MHFPLSKINLQASSEMIVTLYRSTCGLDLDQLTGADVSRVSAALIAYLWLCPLQENLSVTEVSDVQEIDMLAFTCTIT